MRARAAARPDKDRTFLKEAASGGMLEVRLGQLVQQSATDDSVKAFGARMVSDHSQANAELTSLAGSKGITIPTALSKQDQAVYDKLSKMTGAALDRAYMADMVKDHIKDVAEFRKEAKSATDPDVRAFASKTLPILEHHLQMAKMIDGRLKGHAQGHTMEKPPAGQQGQSKSSG